jgi:hypothetical protein
MLAHGQQNRRVIDRFHTVSPGRNHQEIAGSAVPRGFLGDEPDPTFEHLNSGFTRVGMFRHHGACAQSNDGLAEHMLVSAVHGLRAGATRRLRRSLHLLVDDSDERELLHRLSVAATDDTSPDCVSGVNAGDWLAVSTTHRGRAFTRDVEEL